MEDVAKIVSIYSRIFNHDKGGKIIIKIQAILQPR